jgi:hypothetical protein
MTPIVNEVIHSIKLDHKFTNNKVLVLKSGLSVIN